jgi:hypothetical protein
VFFDIIDRAALVIKPKDTMTQKLLIIFALVLSANLLLGQEKLPIIKATSRKVDIRDGDIFKKGDWNITPEAKPDVYTTASKGKAITFYTDSDSISVKITPATKFDFIILLNDTIKALTEIQYKPGFLDILETAGKYNFDDKREITKFTYKCANDPDLAAIRKEFKLDSIIGTGNEVSQILNLLHWVHNSFRHDGSKDAPKYTSIPNLMNICMNEHRTLDCGTLATVLNDSYLALGFKSHRVICLPKDSTDFDCHSINAVYSNILNKWLWIDPTNDAYVMNEKGELLSIAEVRERLVDNKPLILNPEANWNHVNSVTKEYYLYYYMAKNLYAICLESGRGTGQFNLLLPVEYKGVIPRIRAVKPRCTNNPSVFWAKPE